MIWQYTVWLLCIIVILLTVSWALQSRKKYLSLQNEKKDFEGEERRMFDFLHDLGEAIESDSSLQKVNQLIVDGVVKVLNADGGALYLINDSRTSLVPKILTESCPQIIGIPVETMRRAAKDARIMMGYIRSSSQRCDEGILGACLAAGSALHIRDIKSHDSMNDSFVQYDANVSAVVAPLKHGGKDLGVLVVAKNHSQGVFTEHDFAVFRSVAEQGSFAVGNAIVHIEAHEKRSLENELRTAREVQRILLPQEAPNISGYRVEGINIPARIISGDYYDFIDLGNHRWGIIIADVSGKGVAAGLLMAMCRSVLRAISLENPSPSAALAKVNRLLFPDIREDMFISLAYIIIDGAEGQVTMSRAGHDAPLFYHKNDGAVTLIKPPGMAIGVDEGDVFERVTKDFSMKLESGDCILLHTDGIREAMNHQEEEYGTERMKEVFLASAALGANASVTAMLDSVKQFTGAVPQMDDITLVVLEKR